MPFSSVADDDDDWGDFGEFKFASSSSSPKPSQQKQQDDDDDDAVDDDWGDFVQSPLQTTNSNQSPNNSSKKWEKPNGAIPLSIFGDLEEEEEESSQGPDPIQLFNNGFSSHSNLKPVVRDVKDLISDLYSQTPPPHSPPAAAAAAAVNGSDLHGEKDEDDDNGWEFIQADDNGMETVREDTKHLKFKNGGSKLFSSFDTHTNGLNFSSDIAHVESGSGFNHTFENGVDFDCAFSDFAMESKSLGKERTRLDAEAPVSIHARELQGSTDMFTSNQDDMLSSTHAVEKEELRGSSRTVNGSSSEPNSAQSEIKKWKLHSAISVDDIISKLYKEPDRSNDVYAIHHSSALRPESPDLAVLSRHIEFANNDSYSNDDTEWGFQKALDPAVADLKGECKIDESKLYDPIQNTCLNLYNKLKEESIFLVVQHLSDLKKSQESAALSGEEAKLSKCNEGIQVIYKVLQEDKVSEDDYLGKHASKGACVGQLVEAIKEPYVQALVEEYRLSDLILSAEKDVSASIMLLRHASLGLYILGVASRDEQQTYMTAWSRVAIACTKELQHGAMIWNESLRTNICEEILSRGRCYFTALVEIYRVTEILRASLQLYKPWILLNPEDCSRELVSCLERCAETWTTLGKSLESLSAATTYRNLKALLRSDLSELPFQNHAFSNGNAVCKLSLLPVDKLQDMKVITWNGDRYFLKLANLWANRVSCEAPHLPQIHAN